MISTYLSFCVRTFHLGFLSVLEWVWGHSGVRFGEYCLCLCLPAPFKQLLSRTKLEMLSPEHSNAGEEFIRLQQTGKGREYHQSV